MRLIKPLQQKNQAENFISFVLHKLIFTLGYSIEVLYI